MNLATKYRPKRLSEIIAQPALVETFGKFIAQNAVPHSIFYGAAGCGKTSFARVVATEMGASFYEFDGGNLKLESLRSVIKNHENSLLKPLIFIDEIHRLSRTQQEALLIPLEQGSLTLMGASTQNPFYTLTSAIRSRCFLFEFAPISKDALIILAKRVLADLDTSASDEALEYLAHSSSSDVRACLNLLDYALKLAPTLSLESLKTLRPHALSGGVKESDEHYNLASAMIKSLRGSDINAALYYLARLIDGGESADFIARRLVIFASEDVGNANPNALNLATNTLTAVLNIGYPEARIILAQCVVYLASSPKSNSSYAAINAALAYVRENPPLPIPPYLINNTPQSRDYRYPHDFGGWVAQRYLADESLEFYKSKGVGFEKTLDEWLGKIKSKD
ncbi:replication-associated recombination protein A [Campylobacter sp. 19-13652]|uniref:replication-associated recombination protein A n=1 Tax=Campylobacter sp. 19-13652 TaxID=2840180 RepID=UPI001C74A307|nr:replication-associated recombination protein A [Campylobacter sp. 19-13652]BCX78774.1 ATPase AAA [Campylobacter sp. 19-13652]